MLSCSTSSTTCHHIEADDCVGSRHWEAGAGAAQGHCGVGRDGQYEQVPPLRVLMVTHDQMEERLATVRSGFSQVDIVGGSTVSPSFARVPQFFIAPTERLRLVQWDENLKRVDHNDFFTRAYGVLLTVHDK